MSQPEQIAPLETSAVPVDRQLLEARWCCLAVDQHPLQAAERNSFELVQLTCLQSLVWAAALGAVVRMLHPEAVPVVVLGLASLQGLPVVTSRAPAGVEAVWDREPQVRVSRSCCRLAAQVWRGTGSQDAVVHLHPSHMNGQQGDQR